MKRLLTMCVCGLVAGWGAGVAQQPAPANPATPYVAPEDPQASRIETLQLQVRQLRAEIDTLRAKLREALSAQPPGTEAIELVKAQDRIKQLEKEKQLKSGEAQAPKAPESPDKGVKSTAAAKPATAAEKAELKQLRHERDDLRRKVTLLTRQLEDRRLRKGGTQTDVLAEQVAILRARVEAYEARTTPYSPEELALLKQTPVAGRDDAEATAKPRPVPAGAAALLAGAQRDYQAGRFGEAEKKYLQALQLDEKNVAMLTELAASQMEQTKLDDADATLKRALAGDPNDSRALSLQGLLRFRQKRLDEAFDTLARAAQLNPDDAITQNYLGVTLGEKGQKGPAEAAFRKAIQLQPGYPEAHYNLAVAYATHRPPFVELARWHYQRALAGGHPRRDDFEKLLAPTPAPAPQADK